jgi:8-hydroxy-5-deazaflavin:NADPH oxidoreductase
MKIAVLGTGMVGNSLGAKLVQIGHEVTMGSRNANNEAARKWVTSAGEHAHNGTFRDAAAFGEIVIS